MIRAGDVMTTEVTSVSPETPVEELISLLRVSHFTAVPVADAEGKAVGLVSETDILRALAYVLVPPQSGEHIVPPLDEDGNPVSPRDRGATTRLLRAAMLQEKISENAIATLMRSLLDRRVHDVMTPVVFSCRPDDPLHQVCETMVWKGIHRVIVTDDDNKVVGLISSLDLARRFAEELKN